MGFFDFLRGSNINHGVELCSETPGAVLLDVRTRQEYRQGHIPGSTNIPLQEIDQIGAIVGEKETKLFVYCHSGARSRQAVGELQRMGYLHAKNIGGMAAYTGKVESV